MDWNHWKGSHTGATWLQKHSAWRASFGASLHSSHTSESVICLLFKLHLVGKALLQALQTKCFILLGTYIFQSRFQKLLWLSRLDELARSIEVEVARSLQALLVLNSLVGVHDQDTRSGGFLWLSGMPNIKEASQGRKAQFTSSDFHIPSSGLMRELTLVSAITEGREERITLLGFTGNHFSSLIQTDWPFPMC